MNEEMIKKAKETRTVEELIALFKENDIKITDAQAKAVFDRLHAAVGELSDEELDGVSGGSQGSDDIPLKDLFPYDDDYMTQKMKGERNMEDKKNINLEGTELNDSELEQTTGGLVLLGDDCDICARCGTGLLSNSNKYNGKTYCSRCLSIVKKEDKDLPKINR